jgi:hypothetical protein
LYGYRLVPMPRTQCQTPHSVYTSQPVLLVLLDMLLGNHRTPSFNSSPQFRHLGHLRSHRGCRAHVVNLRRFTVSRAVLATQLGAQEPTSQELRALRDHLHGSPHWTIYCRPGMRSCMSTSTILEQLLTSSSAGTRTLSNSTQPTYNGTRPN